MASRKNYFIVGILLSFIFIVRAVLMLLTDSIASAENIVELINWGSIAFMAFCYSYLYPQFKEKDERTNSIRQKGIYYSMFMVLASLIVIMVLIQYGIIVLPTIILVRFMFSLILVTTALSWVILSKQM